MVILKMHKTTLLLLLFLAEVSLFIRRFSFGTPAVRYHRIKKVQCHEMIDPNCFVKKFYLIRHRKRYSRNSCTGIRIDVDHADSVSA